MTIHFVDVYPPDFPSNIDEIIERYEETDQEKDRHKFFTEDELIVLLKLCRLAEAQAQRRMEAATDYGVYGFELVSDDRAPIEEMLEAKKRTGFVKELEAINAKNISLAFPDFPLHD